MTVPESSDSNELSTSAPEPLEKTAVASSMDMSSQPSTPTSRLLGGIALLFMGMAMLAFWPVKLEMSNSLGVGVGLAFGGLVALGGALYSQQHPLSVWDQRLQRYSRPICLWLGIIALIMVGIAGIVREGTVPFLYQQYLLQGALLWGGLLLVILGLSQQPLLFVGWTRREGLALLITLVIAFGLRAWQLDLYRISADDGINISAVFPLLAGDGTRGLVARPSGYHLSQVFAQWQAISLQTWGLNLVGLRFPSALVGVLTVVAVYLMGRALFNVRLALIAALLMATFPPHLHYSRLALPHIADATAGAFALAFSARGLLYKRREDWILAGISLGLTQYFFEAGRLLFLPLVLFLVSLASLSRREILVKQRRQLLIGVIAFVLACMPAYIAAVSNKSLFTERLNVSAFNFSEWSKNMADGLTPDEQRRLTEHFAKPFLLYLYRPELPPLYYGGAQPLVLTPLLPIFLLGIAYLCLRWRHLQSWPLWWLLAVLVANWFMSDSAQTPRHLVGFAAVPLLLAVGLAYGLPITLQGWQRAKLNMAIAILAMLIAIGQTWYYFNIHIPYVTYQSRSGYAYPDYIDAVMRSQDLPKNTHIYLISSHQPDSLVARAFIGLFRFKDVPNVPTIESLGLDSWNQDEIDRLPMDRNYAFYIDPKVEQEVLDKLNRKFALEVPQYTSDLTIPEAKRYILYIAWLDRQKVVFITPPTPPHR